MNPVIKNQDDGMETSAKEIIEREALALRKTLYRTAWVAKLVLLLDACLYIVSQIFATSDGSLTNDPFTYYKWTLAFYYLLLGITVESMARLDPEHYILSTSTQILGLAGSIAWAIADIALVAVDLNYIWHTDTNIGAHAGKLTTFVICDLFQVLTKIVTAALIIYALPKLRTHDVRKVQENIMKKTYENFGKLTDHAAKIGTNIGNILSHPNPNVSLAINKAANVPANMNAPIEQQRNSNGIGSSSSLYIGDPYGYGYGITRITKNGISRAEDKV
jgi:hypothetical protein